MTIGWSGTGMSSTPVPSVQRTRGKARSERAARKAPAPNHSNSTAKAAFEADIARYVEKSGTVAEIGYGIAGVDFLAADAPRATHIVTNPPYGDGLADRFVRKALELTAISGGKVAALLNISSLAQPAIGFPLSCGIASHFWLMSFFGLQSYLESDVVHPFLFRAAMATIVCVPISFWLLDASKVRAQTAPVEPPSAYVPTSPAFKALPQAIQSYVTGLREGCLEAVAHLSAEERAGEFNYIPADEMSGIYESQLGGRRAIIVDNFDVCTSDVVGGNCHNRGCPVNVWVEDVGIWRKVPNGDLRFRFDASTYEPLWLELSPGQRYARCKGGKRAEGCGLRWQFRRLDASQKMPKKWTSESPSNAPASEVKETVAPSVSPVSTPEIDYPASNIDHFGGVWPRVFTSRGEQSLPGSRDVPIHEAYAQIFSRTRASDVEYLLQMRSRGGRSAELWGGSGLSERTDTIRYRLRTRFGGRRSSSFCAFHIVMLEISRSTFPSIISMSRRGWRRKTDSILRVMQSNPDFRFE